MRCSIACVSFFALRGKKRHAIKTKYHRITGVVDAIRMERELGRGGGVEVDADGVAKDRVAAIDDIAGTFALLALVTYNQAYA